MREVKVRVGEGVGTEEEGVDMLLCCVVCV